MTAAGLVLNHQNLGDYNQISSHRYRGPYPSFSHDEGHGNDYKYLDEQREGGNLSHILQSNTNAYTDDRENSLDKIEVQGEPDADFERIDNENPRPMHGVKSTEGLSFNRRRGSDGGIGMAHAPMQGNRTSSRRSSVSSLPEQYPTDQFSQDSLALPDDLDPNERRRLLHLESERRGRLCLKNGFEELKGLIPGCNGKKVTKQVILNKASDYIAALTEKVESLQNQLKSTKKQLLLYETACHCNLGESIRGRRPQLPKVSSSNSIQSQYALHNASPQHRQNYRQRRTQLRHAPYDSQNFKYDDKSIVTGANGMRVRRQEDMDLLRNGSVEISGNNTMKGGLELSNNAFHSSLQNYRLAPESAVDNKYKQTQSRPLQSLPQYTPTYPNETVAHYNRQYQHSELSPSSNSLDLIYNSTRRHSYDSGFGDEYAQHSNAQLPIPSHQQSYIADRRYSLPQLHSITRTDWGSSAGVGYEMGVADFAGVHYEDFKYNQRDHSRQEPSTSSSSHSNLSSRVNGDFLTGEDPAARNQHLSDKGQDILNESQSTSS
ncbi:hypothetical protein BKA69DRAFT_1054809 [Paraphysoderma sedebokerense]|nr:hypothetical protein BKA69DRAFT_1058567 [Paraphysoderma sedebokerense]KAI9144398.1 hypothetical protein BKA69DRAFT_1054809 [Paraphysoderma sedebokerense]